MSQILVHSMHLSLNYSIPVGFERGGALTPNGGVKLKMSAQAVPLYSKFISASRLRRDFVLGSMNAT